MSEVSQDNMEQSLPIVGAEGDYVWARLMSEIIDDMDNNPMEEVSITPP